MLLRGKDSEFVWIFNTFALSNRKLKGMITGSWKNTGRLEALNLCNEQVFDSPKRKHQEAAAY